MCEVNAYPQDRRSKRVTTQSVNVNGELKIANSNRRLPYYLIDISKEGFGVWTSQSIENGQLVSMSFIKLGFWEKVLSTEDTTFDKDENPSLNLQNYDIETECQVIWCKKNDDDFGYRIGIRVTDEFKQSKAYNLVVEAISDHKATRTCL